MNDWSVKVALACDADYRNKLMDKRTLTGSLRSNHETQVYYLMLYLSIKDIQELYSLGGGGKGV